ncbi:hypothetical protein ABZ897_01940 [Nonomuraea sp. NPDC046802]|uniref:hypothetical protein n=1 Tax=Nonomuraea sp. NPDC046802 TaxID=3154919 RepID=UPI0033C9BCD9
MSLSSEPLMIFWIVDADGRLQPIKSAIGMMRAAMLTASRQWPRDSRPVTAWRRRIVRAPRSRSSVSRKVGRSRPGSDPASRTATISSSCRSRCSFGYQASSLR